MVDASPQLILFLVLFCVVYYLDAIGAFYMNSSLQSIEKQFRIPSRVAGFLVSANDIGYIPAVVLVAYWGSKGNRARWIGGGGVLMSIAYILVASPNFLFPVPAPELNYTHVQDTLRPSFKVGDGRPMPSLAELLSHPLIRLRFPTKLVQQLTQFDDSAAIGESHVTQAEFLANYLPERPAIVKSGNRTNGTESASRRKHEPYTVDARLLDHALVVAENSTSSANRTASLLELRALLLSFAERRVDNTTSVHDVVIVKRAATASFGYCSAVVNELRDTIAAAKCENWSPAGPLGVMLVGLTLLGVGRTVPWSLGVPLLDDNTKKKDLPIFFSAITFIKVLGPASGYIIASFVNKIYYNLNPPSGLTPSDPAWIGAWWLGFLVLGALSSIPSLLLFFFPSPSGGTDKSGKKSIRLFDDHSKREQQEGSFKGLQKQACEVLHSRIFVASVAGRILDVLALKGYMSFLPKYLENHFGIPNYQVYRYMAAFGALSFATGCVLGGLIMRRYRFDGRHIALLVTVISALNVILFTGKAFFACDSTVNQVGIAALPPHQAGQAFDRSAYNFTKECNAQCHCGGTPLFPVCDSTGHAFFSPCHAGCRNVETTGPAPHQIEFSACSCASGDGRVSRTNCRDNCFWPKILFFTFSSMGSILAGIGVVPGMLILLRCVPASGRSVSLGVQGLLVSTLGTLPSPLLWGWLVDTACRVVGAHCEGESGTCLIYDPRELRIRMHVVYLLFRGAAVLFDIYIFFNAANLRVHEENVTSPKKGQQQQQQQQSNNGFGSDAVNPMDLKMRDIGGGDGAASTRR